MAGLFQAAWAASGTSPSNVHGQSGQVPISWVGSAAGPGGFWSRFLLEPAYPKAVRDGGAQIVGDGMTMSDGHLGLAGRADGFHR